MHDTAIVDDTMAPQGGRNFPWLASYPRHVSWEASFAPRPLFALMDQAAAAFGTRPCTNFYGRVETYGEIGAKVDAAAAALQQLGVGKGTKVGLFLPNTPTYVVYYYGALKAGATIVNFNPLYTVDELAAQAADSGTELMVTLDLKPLFGKVDALLERGVLKRAIVCSFAALLPAGKSLLFRLFRSGETADLRASTRAERILLESDLAGPVEFVPVPIDVHEDIAVLQYTGGTTGTPKGAMLTHANIHANVEQIRLWKAEIEPGRERMLAVLPFFHVFAMTVVLNFSVAVAAEILVMPRFALDATMKLIDGNKPTAMPGVPTLFNAIMNHPKLARFDLSSLKFCLSGGAPLPREVKSRFETLTGCKVIEGYGLSEASPVVTCNPLEGARDGSIGLPLPGTLVSLRDLEAPAREVSQGEKGEICVKGPQVMKGYWGRPEDTAAQFTSDGYLRTGDVARMDADGFFYIEDRLKDLIICSGYNVYPRQVEEAIYAHPAVLEVTVIGIADSYRGEAPKAFVRLKEDEALTEAELLAFLEARLNKIEMPAAIEFRDSLPKTLIGKLSKKELKQEEAERAAEKAIVQEKSA